MGGGHDQEAVSQRERFWREVRIDAGASDLCGDVATIPAHYPGEVTGVPGVQRRDEIVLHVRVDDRENGFGAQNRSCPSSTLRAAVIGTANVPVWHKRV